MVINLADLASRRDLTKWSMNIPSEGLFSDSCEDFQIIDLLESSRLLKQKSLTHSGVN